MATIMTLRNFLDTSVSFKWDGELYTLDAGEEVKLPEAIARHGAKYVAMESFNLKGKAIAQVTNDFINEVDKALSGSELHASEVKAEVALVNDSKKKTSKKKEEDEIFEGL